MALLIADGWRVLWQDFGPVLVVLACLLWGSTVLFLGLRRMDGDAWTLADFLSLASGGWVAALFLIAMPVFLLGALLGLRPNVFVASMVLIGSAAGLLILPRSEVLGRIRGGSVAAVGLAALFVLNLWVRLAFVARANLPLYFDSAEHYRIIQVLVEEYRQASAPGVLTWPAPTYYHVGFHVIMAVLASITGQNLAQTMLVAGQIVLAAVPFGLLILPRRETGSTTAGFMAVILAMAGWYMPAYAVNWGKYPAIFSLPVILLCLNLAYLANRSERGRRRRLLVLAAVTGIVAFLLHTRAILLLVIACVTWWLGGQWAGGLGAQRRRIALLFALLILIVECTAVLVNPALSGVLDPYVGSGLPVTLVIALTGVAGFWKYPRLASACLLSIMLLLLGLFIPVPGLGTTSLLDRPLVEMVLFVPLSLLGAIGIAATLEHIARISIPLRTTAVVAVCAAVGVHAVLNYSFYPAECCVLVQGDDLVALDWIAKNLAANARIAIPTEQLQAAPAPYAPLDAGTDAGAWITPLTGRPTTGLQYTTDFRQGTALDQLCSARVDDLYVSTTSQGFSRAYVDAEPAWYELELSLPHVRIYRLIGCSS